MQYIRYTFTAGYIGTFPTMFARPMAEHLIDPHAKYGVNASRRPSRSPESMSNNLFP